MRDGRVRGEGENRASSWRVAWIKAERCWLAEEGRESRVDERATDQTGDKRCERDVSRGSRGRGGKSEGAEGGAFPPTCSSA